MRKVIIGLVVLAVLLIGAIAVLPELIPSSVYKDKIQTQLTNELGRDVVISGDVKLAVFPTIKARTGRVEIANADGFSAPYFAAMEGLDAKVKLLPLLSKRIEISAFTLNEPVINLQKNALGKPNWLLGKQDGQVATDETPKGPFKRDGRYTTLDPQIGLFAINNGTITYKDESSGANYDLSAVNVDFSLPSLLKPVKVDGDLSFNNDPMNITLTVDTPRDFLDGKEASASLSFKTPYADLDAKGKFLASQDIAFDMNINGKVTDIKALTARLPMDVPYANVADIVTLNGNYMYDGTTFSARGADIKAEGAAFNAAFNGDAALTNPPNLNGDINFEISDVKSLANMIGQDAPGLDLADSVILSAALTSAGKGFAANNIDALVKGNGLNATFKGTGSYGDSLNANGSFTADAASIPSLVKALKLDLPQANALGSARVQGNLNQAGDTTKLDNLSVSLDGSEITGRFDGSVTKTENLALKGTFETKVESLSRVAETTQMPIPYAGSVGQISARGTISGNDSIFDITDLDAQMVNGQINGRYQGSASTRDGFKIDGQLDADIPSIRAIAAQAGTQLPTSTDAGSIYETLTISGQVSGSPSDITFKQATLSLDHLKGKGDFAVDLKPSKPFLNGTLDLEGLDLRPYMASYAAQNPTGKIQPWSEEPLNVSMLNAVDSDLKIDTPNIITDRMSIGQSTIDAEIRNGILTANMPNLALYGGLGRMTASLDASKSVPSVALDVNLSNLSSESFLGAVAGFTKASGDAGTALQIRGSGNSQAAIMRSLTGAGDFKVLDGQIAGVDLGQFLTGLDTALTSRSLPSGLGSEYTTKFKDIVGLFSIENGVAKVSKFSLDGLGVLAEGQGQIDLGNQAIDFSLRPRLTGESASDLAAFGIPIRFTGTFGNVSAGLDTDLLSRIVAEKAKTKARGEVTKIIDKKIGGGVGDIIGGVLGGSQSPSEETSTTSTSPVEKTDPEKPEDVLQGVLGSILKSDEKAPTPPEGLPSEEKAKTAEPDPAEVLLKGLFGKKEKEAKPDEKPE